MRRQTSQARRERERPVGKTGTLDREQGESDSDKSPEHTSQAQTPPTDD